MFIFQFFSHDITLDPRTKLLVVFLLTVMVFFVSYFPITAILLLFFIIIRLVLRIPFYAINYFKNLSLLAVFIILMQTLFFPGTDYILENSFLKWEGFFLGVTIVFRIFALVLIFSLFTETTSAAQLAAALNAMGLKYRYAFIVSFGFNLIPFFREEALAVMDAQKLRGMRPGIKAYTSLAIPLLLGAMRKAQAATQAMDCRAFGVYETRTWLDKPQMKKYDFIAIGACAIFCTFVLFLNCLFLQG